MILDELKRREPGIPQQTPEDALQIFKSEYSGNESAFINCAFDESAQARTHLGDVNGKTRMPNGVVEKTNAKNMPQKNSHGKTHGKPRRQIQPLRRVAVAAVLIILVTLFFTSTALGGYWWRSLLQWGRETFKFADDIAPVHINEELVSLHDALMERGITERLAPTWIPNDFILIDFSVTELPIFTIFLSHLQNGSKNLIIKVSSLTDSAGATYEKTGEEYSVYIRNGIEHYIIENEGQLIITWKNMDY